MSRPWYRLHLLTWAVLFVVGAALAYGQFLRVTEHFKTSGPSYSLGWPRVYATKSSPSDPLNGVDRRCLAVNAGWWIGMITPLLILCERWTRRHFRFSLKVLLGMFAAATVLMAWTDWLYYWVLIKYDPSRLVLKSALSVVTYGWLAMVAVAVIGAFATVWNRSSSTSIRITSYLFIVLTAGGISSWLYFNGFTPADHGWRGCLSMVLPTAVGSLLTFGLLIRLSSELAGFAHSHLPEAYRLHQSSPSRSASRRSARF